LNALISGPVAGGNWEDGDDAPRSISDKWWGTVCSDPEDMEIIWSDDAKRDVRDASGDRVFQHWSDLLRRSPKKCVEVKGGPSGDDGWPQVGGYLIAAVDPELMLPHEGVRPLDYGFTSITIFVGHFQRLADISAALHFPHRGFRCRA
jgi:hypothetical protein